MLFEDCRRLGGQVTSSCPGTSCGRLRCQLGQRLQRLRKGLFKAGFRLQTWASSGCVCLLKVRLDVDVSLGLLDLIAGVLPVPELLQLGQALGDCLNLCRTGILQFLHGVGVSG